MIINDTFININKFIAVDNKKDATIIITHGMAEYSLAHEETALFFQSKGYNVITYDVRGHGKSLGKRGHLDRYQDFLDDLNDIVLNAKKSTKKVFLIGHSMGGIISNLYAVTYGNIDGVVSLSAPSDYIRKVKKLKYLPKIFYDNKKIMTNFNDPRLLSTGKSEKNMYDLDFYYGSLVAEILVKGIRKLKLNFRKYKVPLLAIGSKKDRLISYNMAINLYEKVQSKDKKLIIFEESYHNILNDIEKDKVRNEILKWLDKRIWKSMLL